MEESTRSQLIHKNYMRQIFVITCILAGVVALDQYTKLLIISELSFGEEIQIVPGFFNLTLVFNPGVAFGFLGNVSDALRHVIIGFTTLLALSVVLFLFFKEYKSDIFGKIFLSMILGGAIGNLIDRFRIGAVIDFLDVYVGTYHWPAFNVADSFICIGVVLLIARRPKVKDF